MPRPEELQTNRSNPLTFFRPSQADDRHPTTAKPTLGFPWKNEHARKLELLCHRAVSSGGLGVRENFLAFPKHERLQEGSTFLGHCHRAQQSAAK
jgi:hypothetical protein